MNSRLLSEKLVANFKNYLNQEEKSMATINKYICDVKKFYLYAGCQEISKSLVISYKKELQKKYKTSSVNSMLVALNRFFEFLDWPDLKVKELRIQKRVFSKEEEELTQEEYERLLEAAKSKNNEKLVRLMQTICSTGIRVSEHKYVTVESLKLGYLSISNKGKTREIYFPNELKKLLVSYCKRNGIKTGSIFITKNGNPLDRSNIWKMMKTLCIDAKVDSKKVYPHNLRHLFAITYYSLEKDIVHLADILGHSSIETTRLYIKTNSKECQKIFNQMNLVKLNM